MNKVKILSILVGLLVILNIVALSLMFFKKGRGHKGKPRGHRSESSIKDRFKFDDNQMSVFEISRSKHKEISKQLKEDLEAASKTYYATTQNDSLRQLSYRNISEVTKRIYEANMNHFDEVRAICNEDQLPHMENFIHSLINKRKKKHRGNKKK